MLMCNNTYKIPMLKYYHGKVSHTRHGMGMLIMSLVCNNYPKGSSAHVQQHIQNSNARVILLWHGFPHKTFHMPDTSVCVGLVDIY